MEQALMILFKSTHIGYRDKQYLHKSSDICIFSLCKSDEETELKYSNIFLPAILSTDKTMMNY